MAILKVMENRLMKMGIIISGNLKKTKDMEKENIMIAMIT